MHEKGRRQHVWHLILHTDTDTDTDTDANTDAYTDAATDTVSSLWILGAEIQNGRGIIEEEVSVRINLWVRGEKKA